MQSHGAYRAARWWQCELPLPIEVITPLALTSKVRSEPPPEVPMEYLIVDANGAEKPTNYCLHSASV